jgi:hypothetical protein
MANRTEPGLAAWPQRAGCMVALGSSNHFQRNPESERYSGSVTASRTHSKRAQLSEREIVLERSNNRASGLPTRCRKPGRQTR